MQERSYIRHVVFFSAKNKHDVRRIKEGLSLLAGIPHSQAFEVCENVHADALSGEIDIVVYAEFKDATAMAAYKEHQLYQEAIDLVRPLRELRIAADF